LITGNLSKVGQIADRSNRPRTEIILATVLEFQVDRISFHGGEVDADFGGNME